MVRNSNLPHDHFANIDCRHTARELIWLKGDGSWNGGKIPGATLYVLPKDAGRTVFAMKMIEAKRIFDCLLWEGKVLRIDHPEQDPYLYFAVIKGPSVGVFMGWFVPSPPISDPPSDLTSHVTF
jgi:hypothetical protein